MMHLVTRSMTGYPSDPNHDSYMQNLAQACLHWRNLEAWLRGGTSPIALKGHIGALLSSPLLSSSVKSAMKDQLCNVRAFLNHNEHLLEEDPSKWPVEHTVLQLASQEPDGVFAHAESMPGDDDGASLATKPPLIDWLNKPARHCCRLTMRARNPVMSVVYSKCGSKLVRAEGNHVVVCDAVTGFVESTLTVDAGIVSVCFSPTDNVIAAGCSNGNIYLVDAQAGEVKSSLSGHRYDPFPCIECLLL